MITTKIFRIEPLLPEKNKKLLQKQIKYAIYQKGIDDYEKITTIPKDIRMRLKNNLGDVLSLKNIFEVEGGQAQKVLFETKDGHKIEAVRMLFRPEDDIHESLCISSQSGCALGCRFCATGAIGFKKNLTAEEISDQVLYFKSKGQETDSISFMGMGEPLSNPENVFGALEILTSPDYMGISPRRINVSTVGIVPQIKKLTDRFPQVNLAFSLHSPFPEERLKLMPVTGSYSIDAVMEVLDEHIKKTRRRVFLAYILLSGINDDTEHAKALIDLIKKRGEHSYLYHVNLIRYHAGPTDSEFKETSKEKIDAFRKILDDKNISNSLRQSFGLKIFAACGQLYGGYNKK